MTTTTATATTTATMEVKDGPVTTTLTLAFTGCYYDYDTGLPIEEEWTVIEGSTISGVWAVGDTYRRTVK